MGSKVSDFMENVQDRVKFTALNLVIFLFRLISGFVLGLTFSLVFDTIYHYQTFSFLFVLVLVMSIFMRASKGWGLVHLFVFDLVCVLFGLILRMYLLIAPGA